MNTQEYISSGILEAYILGTASKDEAGILECVMAHNAEVRAAYEEAQKILEDFTTAQAIEVPDSIKGKIWEKIKSESHTNLQESFIRSCIYFTDFKCCRKFILAQ